MTHPPGKSEPVTKKDLGQYKVEIALILIAAIMSAVISVAVFSYQSYQTDKNEKRNIATGYMLEIENLEPDLSEFLAFNASRNTTPYIPIIKLDNFYPSYGLYYSNRADISKLDPQVSAELYRFYYHMLHADDQRKLFNSYDTDYPPGNLPVPDTLDREKFKMRYYFTMMSDINASYQQIPEIKEQLKKYVNSGF